ncbi:LOW QUALITY PROTEIN: Gag protein [Phytophthora palmivora]|uniref:Gag protein n=1 Tax=Phytophthora palmivora TaxID=4796 RepID=A0A2P4X8K5_9STRA|nr:LOW QUALITY PROTEIN: Gag protein [Phytophthora palmivora]
MQNGDVVQGFVDLIAFALSNLGGPLAVHARGDVAGLLHNLGSAVSTAQSRLHSSNYEYHQRSRFLAYKKGSLHEYIQEMRVLAASLVGNPVLELIKVTVFMDGLKVGPSRTQLFRVHANTMEEAIQIALQAPTGSRSYVGRNASTVTVQGDPSAVTDVGSSGTCIVPPLWEGKEVPFQT